MPVFEIEKDGKTYEVDATDKEAAIKGFSSYSTSGKEEKIPDVFDDPMGAFTGRVSRGASEIKEGAEEAWRGPGKDASFMEMAFPPGPRKMLGGAAQIAGAIPEAITRGAGEAVSRGIGAVLPEKFTPKPETIEGGLALLGPKGGLPKPPPKPPSFSEGGPLSPSASRQIERALKRDEMTPTQVQEAAGKAPEGAVIGDVAGENVRGLIQRIAKTPGAGRTMVVPFLEKRQQGQMARIAEDLTTLTGSNRTALEAVDETLKARSQEAAPLWSKAYEAGDKPIWSPVLERLSGAGEVQQAMHGAVNGWNRSQIASGYGAMNPGAKVDRGGILSFLHGKVPVFPNLQFWDYTKAALDDMVSAEIRPDGTMTRKGRDLSIIVKKLRDELDKEVGSYRAARDSWSGHSSYLNSINLGKGILSRSKNAEEMIAEFRDLSEVDKQAYREGALSEITRRMEHDPSKLPDMTKLLRSPAMRQIISEMMPTALAAEKWNNRLGFEIGSSEMVRKGLTGSPTYTLFSEAKDASEMIADLGMDLVTGHKVNPIKKLLEKAYGKARDTFRSKVDREIAEVLTKPEHAKNMESVLAKPQRSSKPGEPGWKRPPMTPPAPAGLQQVVPPALGAAAAMDHTNLGEWTWGRDR